MNARDSEILAADTTAPALALHEGEDVFRIRYPARRHPERIGIRLNVRQIAEWRAIRALNEAIGRAGR
jgi:hypothetical protein